jgi:hypothetical protein
LYATEQLRGLAWAWWASYLIALPADHHVAWDEFRIAFYGHHTPHTCRVSRAVPGEPFYVGQHPGLQQPSIVRGHHVDSDAKKAELYRKGLNIQLQDRLV